MVNLIDIFYRFFILGLVSFGGPIAHIAYFKKTFVDKLKWLDDENYGKIVALSQFLPGPSSSQVGFTIGLKRGGIWGAILAFIAFTLPSFLFLYFLWYFGIFQNENHNLCHLEEGNEITVVRSSEEKHVKQLHGTTRALLANMIEGVHNGYSKTLEIVGIGYRGQMKGNTLVLNIGFSHQVEIEAEEGVKVETPNPNTIVVSGIDKERVGQMAALIRSKKKPEPYKGKGIKYSDERIIRKEGKTAGKK